ncbi:MAG: dockerin type I domain-containing protein, partial [Candidatus Thermoplasmatota archaeon]|nr:dockerin type I domain-containing protein [Candidatus Thermoplasmatota archaeon]
DAILHWDSNGNNINDATSHAYANLTVVSSPVLSIEKADSDDPIQAGEELVYYLWINNTGDANATNVIVVETYDINTTFSYAVPSPTYGNNTWVISRINAGESKTIAIHVNIPPLPNGTILCNYANVTCDEGSSDETTELTNVTSLPALEIEKAAFPSIVESGGKIMYKIWVNNTGTAPATNVVLRELYDDNVSFNYSYPPPDDMANKMWVFDVVEVGIPEVITIFVDVSHSVEDGNILHNFVNVTCNEGMYDQAWANVTVQSAPPITVKQFHGFVYNITLFAGDGGYILHYITDETTITLVATDMPLGGQSGINHTYYRIFKWNYSTSKWNILLNWEEYGVWNAYPPFYPIDLAELGIEYGYPPCGKYEIEFYSVDKEGNREGMKWNDVFVDCDVPQSYVMPLPYKIYGDMFEVNVNASDDGGVKEVRLYYRYSEDNETWGDWSMYGSKTDDYTWTFIPSEGMGYYQFYSVAEDYVGHMEALPDETIIPDAICKFIRFPWDVNGDGYVDIFDIVIVAQHWMENSSSPHWCEDADVNGDGEVNMADVIMIADHWTG